MHSLSGIDLLTLCHIQNAVETLPRRDTVQYEHAYLIAFFSLAIQKYEANFFVILYFHLMLYMQPLSMLMGIFFVLTLGKIDSNYRV